MNVTTVVAGTAILAYGLYGLALYISGKAEQKFKKLAAMRQTWGAEGRYGHSLLLLRFLADRSWFGVRRHGAERLQHFRYIEGAYSPAGLLEIRRPSSISSSASLPLREKRAGYGRKTGEGVLAPAVPTSFRLGHEQKREPRE